MDNGADNDERFLLADVVKADTGLDVQVKASASSRLLERKAARGKRETAMVVQKAAIIIIMKEPWNEIGRKKG